MLVQVVSVLTVSCLVSNVLSVADLETNVVTEDSLQDLNFRTKKSPTDGENIADKPSESKSKSELKLILTEDIKRKIDDLKELKNAYKKVEEDFFDFDNENKKNKEISKELPKSISDNSNFSEEAKSDEPIRITRQYSPSYFDNNQYQYNKQLKDIAFSDIPSYNKKYQSIDSSYSNRGDPYIAQYNPSSRTFGAAGVKGGFQVETHQPHQVSELIPTVSLHSAGLNPIKTFEHVPSVPAIKEEVTPSRHPSPVSEHNPNQIQFHTVQPHEVKAPLYFEKKEIGLPGRFFSKQIIFGPTGDDGSEHSRLPYQIPAYAHTEPYYAPAYSSYPQGYANGYSPYAWNPTESYFTPSYSYYPDVQSSYRPIYSSAYPYQHGQSYSPLSKQYKSNTEAVSNQYQSYQDQLDSMLSQFFRADSSVDGLETSSKANNQSSIDQLKKDIESEHMKMTILKDLSQNDAQSQSLVRWLTNEFNDMYSRWVNLKNDITKSEQNSGAKKEENKSEVQGTVI